jgi:type I restriction enzyme S subunit
MEKGTIIISARGLLAKIVILPKEMAFNQSCYAICPKDDGLCNDYLYYNLKLQLRLLEQGFSRAVFNTIIKIPLNNLELDLPKVDCQKKIASILSAYDDTS